MAEKTKTIGIMGGGQLGLMIVEQAHLLGARTLCLDPAPDAPAFALSDGHIVAAYDDAAALEELCRRSDVVTYEFENVPGSVLIPLEKKYNIPQGFRPLYDSQDRLREKDNARANGLRTPLYAAVDDEALLRAALAEIGFPAVLKTRTLGYDGHGQLVLKDEADVPRALPMLSVPCVPQIAGSPTRKMCRPLRFGSSASMRLISRATAVGSIFTPSFGVPVQP